MAMTQVGEVVLAGFLLQLAPFPASSRGLLGRMGLQSLPHCTLLVALPSALGLWRSENPYHKEVLSWFVFQADAESHL